MPSNRNVQLVQRAIKHKDPLTIARQKAHAAKSPAYARMLEAQGRTAMHQDRLAEAKAERIRQREADALVAQVEQRKADAKADAWTSMQDRIKAKLEEVNEDAKRAEQHAEPRFVRRQRWVNVAVNTPYGVRAVPQLQDFYEEVTK